MVDTLESIEDELNPAKQNTLKEKLWAKAKSNIMNNMIGKLVKQRDLLKEIPGVNADEVVKSLITGKRKLDATEFEAAVKKFGTKGIAMVEGLEALNKAQKQYIFRRLGYRIEEVE